MLVSRKAPGGPARRQGSRPRGLKQLRHRLGSQSSLDDGDRQCLLELAGRLARIKALGDGYARLELSEYVVSAMDRGAVTV